MFITEKHRAALRELAKGLSRYLEAMNQLTQQPSSMGELITGVAVERTLHIAVEILVDMSNILIDALIMRDPGSYQDIIDIMLDESVLSEETANNMKSAVEIRTQLVHRYLDTFPLSMIDQARELYPWFQEASSQILRYAGV